MRDPGALLFDGCELGTEVFEGGMIRFLTSLFQPDEDELGRDLRAALATLVKRAMKSGEGVWTLDLRRCSIRGVPVGDWRITVSRIDYEEEHGANAQPPPALFP